ncbi:DegV family protein [Pseudoramibacter alactolyticus]|jgi:DegV family protein with EDD domain|uniref:DegV family protein n=1 Tax=Pseudoramibacter alactolyticus TaxID=113287 RepID=UPI002353274C|nr:DegV family protein [Pseudoramibacter alactolyticus]
MGIQFITDSMCDVDEAILHRYPFEILPIPITIGDKTFFDGIDITPDMVIDAVDAHPDTFPKTSQVQTVAYQKAFEKHLARGDDIIYLALSSGLSGTFQTASLIASQLLEDYPDRKIAVVDSLCATTGMMLILHQGLKLGKLGRPFEEIVDTMTFLARHVNIYFLVGDIKWLAKGGRIGKNVALIGDMLKIKPILYFQDGRILAYEKIRGQKKAERRLFELVDQKMPDKRQCVGFIESKAPELQEKARKTLTKDLGIKNFIVPQTGAGAALTVHIGPKCLGIMFFDALPDNYINVTP